MGGWCFCLRGQGHRGSRVVSILPRGLEMTVTEIETPCALPLVVHAFGRNNFWQRELPRDARSVETARQIERRSNPPWIRPFRESVAVHFCAHTVIGLDSCHI